MIKCNFKGLLNATFCFLAIFNLSNAYSFVLSNINDGDKTIRFQINQQGTANPSESESCWAHQGSSIYILDLNFGEKISTGFRDNLPARYVCVEAQIGFERYAINPIHDVPECVIEFIKIEGGGEGTARATPACGFNGRCPDGNTWSNRAACLPTSYP